MIPHVLTEIPYRCYEGFNNMNSIYYNKIYKKKGKWMNKKGLYKALSVILIMVIILPMLPGRVIKAEEYTVFSPEGDVSVVSPSAITAMAAEDRTILDI